MNKDEQAKIKRFMSDELMSASVYELLLKSFMKRRDADVNLKAAQMVAIELLQDAWKDLERQKDKKDIEPSEGIQIGL